MMGLGYKRSHKKLMHPKHLPPFRREDEALSDLVVLGAIVTFGLGTLVWFVLDDAPPLIFTPYYDHRAYMQFFFPFLNVFLFSLFLVWALGPARVWPRIAMILLCGCVGMWVLLVRVIPAEETREQWVGGLLVLYCTSLVFLSLRQVISILRAGPDNGGSAT